ncbi:response regulator transcription factor [Hamadaea tsunoensis]|uniref:response regulator transcription factor n=1 Tax=Hamadaea tsunoensis TaxID=53368 RepID=UPI0003FAE216|nr:response regulator transcription factor [Hamadaea tsunoensis]
MSVPGLPAESASPVRVLIVDDDPLVRAALNMMLDGAPGIVVAAVAADGDEVPAALDAYGVDVILMDLRMARVDGITATRRVRARPRAPEVVVLTTFDADENVVRALRAGAAGFLLKDTPPERIVHAVRTVAGGEPILSPRIVRRLMDRVVLEAGVADRARAALARLSPRERDVAAAVARGSTNAEIAEELAMSVATVKAHMTRVLEKLEMTNRTQIALLVHDAGGD